MPVSASEKFRQEAHDRMFRNVQVAAGQAEYDDLRQWLLSEKPVDDVSIAVGFEFDREHKDEQEQFLRQKLKEYLARQEKSDINEARSDEAEAQRDEGLKVSIPENIKTLENEIAANRETLKSLEIELEKKRSEKIELEQLNAQILEELNELRTKLSSKTISLALTDKWNTRIERSVGLSVYSQGGHHLNGHRHHHGGHHGGGSRHHSVSHHSHHGGGSRHHNHHSVSHHSHHGGGSRHHNHHSASHHNGHHHSSHIDLTPSVQFRTVKELNPEYECLQSEISDLESRISNGKINKALLDSSLEAVCSEITRLENSVQRLNEDNRSKMNEIDSLNTELTQQIPQRSADRNLKAAERAERQAAREAMQQPQNQGERNLEQEEKLVRACLSQQNNARLSREIDAKNQELAKHREAVVQAVQNGMHAYIVNYLNEHHEKLPKLNQAQQDGIKTISGYMLTCFANRGEYARCLQEQGELSRQLADYQRQLGSHQQRLNSLQVYISSLEQRKADFETSKAGKIKLRNGLAIGSAVSLAVSVALAIPAILMSVAVLSGGVALPVLAALAGAFFLTAVILFGFALYNRSSANQMGAQVTRVDGELFKARTEATNLEKQIIPGKQSEISETAEEIELKKTQAADFEVKASLAKADAEKFEVNNMAAPMYPDLPSTCSSGSSAHPNGLFGNGYGSISDVTASTPPSYNPAFQPN